jgi:hypothetical protein
VVVRVPTIVPASAAAESLAILGSTTVVDKVLGFKVDGLRGMSVQAHLRRRTVRVDTALPVMPGTLSAVAPLRQWSHDRAMRVERILVVQATFARHGRWVHQESGGAEPWYVRRYNISLQADRER